MQKLIQRQYNKIVYVSAIINLKFQKFILTTVMTTEAIRHLRELMYIYSLHVLNLTFDIKKWFWFTT